MRFFLLAIWLRLASCEVTQLDAKVAVNIPETNCDFAVHKNGPDGELVAGTNLDVSLYYTISCKPAKGFCLQVSNCTVSGDRSNDRPYPIIDHRGCALEPSLFEHVEYRGDFSAGIANPFPVRFRGESGSVLLFCVTTLVPREGPVCTRPQCS